MKVFFTLLFAFNVTLLTAQSPDSLEQATSMQWQSKDSLVGKTKKPILKDLLNFKKDYPSPQKAVLLSAILPGAGQVYNKNYWKLPIIYGAIGGLVYSVHFNTNEYNRYKALLKKRIEDNEFSQDIRSIRDEYEKRKDLSYIGLVAVYVLTGVDAYVDAHLVKFDVSDDLSLHVNPSFKVLPDRTTSLGVGVGLNIKGKEKPVLPVEFTGR